METKEILAEIRKHSKLIREQIVFDLVRNDDVDFIALSNAYMCKLESDALKTERKLATMASCLSTEFSELKDKEFNRARSAILLYPYVPDEFIEQRVLNGVSESEIDKQKKWLKDNGIETK